jgi:hypothetical protein
MRKFLGLPIVFIMISSLTVSLAQAKDYVIYSVAQDIPMGNKDEVIKKNFYIDMGQNQGVKKGSILDVYRVISVLDPYESKKRFNHRIKIGELKVLHSEDTSAIAALSKLEEGDETPVFEVGKMMIGDIVTVKVK